MGFRLDMRKVSYIIIGILVALLIMLRLAVSIPNLEKITIVGSDEYSKRLDKMKNDVDFLFQEDSEASEEKIIVGYRVHLNDIDNKADYGRDNPMYFIEKEILEPIEDPSQGQTQQGDSSLGTQTPNLNVTDSNDKTDSNKLLVDDKYMDVTEDNIKEHNKQYSAVRNGVANGFNKETQEVEAVSVARAFNSNKAYLRYPLDKDMMRRTSNFGVRVDPIDSNRDSLPFHTGIDLSQKGIHNKPVYAVTNGVVKTIQNSNSGYGKMVVLQHDTGMETYYAHLNKISSNLREGDLVRTGTILGNVGSTGRSTGSHLHFEVNFNGVAINPELLISFMEQPYYLEFIDKDKVTKESLNPLDVDLGPLTPLNIREIEKLFDLDGDIDSRNKDDPDQQARLKLDKPVEEEGLDQPIKKEEVVNLTQGEKTFIVEELLGRGGEIYYILDKNSIAFN